MMIQSVFSKFQNKFTKIKELKDKGFQTLYQEVKTFTSGLQREQDDKKAQYDAFLMQNGDSLATKLANITGEFRLKLLSEIQKFQTAFLGKKIAKYEFTLHNVEIMRSSHSDELQVLTTGQKYQRGAIEVQMIEDREFSLTQTIFLSQHSFHAVFSDQKGQSQYKKIIVKSNMRDEDQPFYELNSDSLIATGSTQKYFILIQNRLKRAVFGSMSGSKSLQEGREFRLFYPDRIHRVISACLIPEKRFLYALNQDGRLFEIQMNSKQFLQREVSKPKDYDEDQDVKREEIPKLQGVEKFVSRRGQNFKQVVVSPDESLIFLCSSHQIQAFKLNFILYHRIEFEEEIKKIKVFQNQNFNIFCIQFKDDSVDFYSLESTKTFTKVKKDKLKDAEQIPGNPSIDVIHHMLSKFGYDFSFLTSEDYERKFKVVVPKVQKNKEIKQYIQKLDSVKNNLNFQGVVSFENLQDSDFEEEDLEFTREELFWIVYTRVPLHLASVQQHNLVPLKNGVNTYQEFLAFIEHNDQNLVQEFVEFIQFGHFEDIFKKLRGNPFKVIGIMGRQSSGKSYLLNRLTGARFDVSSHRCTQGIWMSLARVRETFFIVLDCEGLFSMQRTVQEELKMCLLLSAISDVVILNQDMAVNRNLTYMFEKFVDGLDRLKGKDLFQGYLEIIIRDVPENQDEGAISQLVEFIGNLIHQGKAEFILQLFKGKYTCVPFHNFQNHLFDETVQERREHYCQKLNSRWTDAAEFEMILKTVLAQIYCDDSIDTSERTLSFKINKAVKELQVMLTNQDQGVKIMGQKYFQYNVKFKDQEQFKLKIPIFSEDYGDDVHHALEEQLFSRFDQKLKRVEHNSWHHALSDMAVKLTSERSTLLLEHFKNAVGKNEEFKSRIELEIFKARDIINTNNNQPILCLKKCGRCGLCCALKDMHSEQECDCMTDHQCIQKCELCEVLKKCKLRACHDGPHMCDSNHTCKQYCKFCDKFCAKLPNHPGDHRCQMASHPCNKKCPLYDLCRSKCMYSLEEEHKFHKCASITCPLPCTFKCGRTCSNGDHLHSLADQGHSVSSHICNQKHPCRAVCQRGGICELDIKTEVRVWKSKYNQFTYHYSCLRPIIKTCQKLIPQGCIEHATKHSCSIVNHRCKAQCPDCSTYCEKNYDHHGMHSSNSHRNKEQCVYIASTKETTVGDEKSGSAMKIIAGQQATPLFCDQSCSERGRGHTHPKICPGGYDCAALKYPGRAVHSDEKFYPNLDSTYDLLNCQCYWNSQNWTAPVQSKNKKAQETFQLCNYYCSHPDHGEEKVFCEDKLFHSTSLKYCDHHFPCKHDFFSKYDIVFVIDSTGSMDWCFQKVKQSIKKILEKVGDKEGISTRFGVVSYTDHSPDDNSYGQPPVKYQANLESKYSSSQALEFLHSLSAGGGGSTGGQAVLDGLNCANTKIKWREKSQRVYILALDEGPHGEQFAGKKYEYPSGCPCKLNWKHVLNQMKKHKSQFVFVNCGGSYLKLTINLFEQHYGEGWELLNLDNVQQFDLKVSNFVGSLVQFNYEFSLK